MQQTKSKNPKMRVLLADMHQVVRNGIRQEIENQADMIVVGETADGCEVVNLAQRLRPDVIILDVKLSGQNGVSATRCLNEIVEGKGEMPNWTPAVIVFTAYNDKQYVWSLLAAGAKGYLLKSEPLEQLVAGIRQVIAGQTVLSQAVQTNMIELIPNLNQRLSDAEIQVVQLLARGGSNYKIAQNLHIAESTVRSHLNNIYRKIPWIRTRAEAVTWAWINRIVTAESDSE